MYQGRSLLMRPLCFLLVLNLTLSAESEYLFSPNGNITLRIIQEIEKAESEIVLAVYMITSEKIVNALIAAHQKGVLVKVVTDEGCIQSPYGKIYHLIKAGIPVKMFCPIGKNKKFPPLMHAKYAVIDKKKSIEGSFNWTNSAEIWNAEHVRITNNEGHKNALLGHFTKLFNESTTSLFVCHPAQEEKWHKKKDAFEKKLNKQLIQILKKEEKDRLKLEKKKGSLLFVYNQYAPFLKKHFFNKKQLFALSSCSFKKKI